jgi:hypothetical protein
MQFDNIKLANISLDTKNLKPEHTRAEVYKGLVPVLEKLATKKLGRWKIVGTDIAGRFSFTVPPEDLALFVNFKVYENDEHIGSISMRRGQRGRKSVEMFGVTSERIEKWRGSRCTKETTKEDVAIRTALKYFVPTSMDEVVQKQLKEADRVCREIRSHANNKLSRLTAQSEMLPAFARYAHANLDSFQKFMEQSGDGLKYDADTFDDILRNREIVNSVAKYETAVVVLVDSQMHIVTKNAQGQETKQVFNEDDSAIPEHVRGRVGLLKLSQDGQVVENVGVRINNNTFTIII